MAATARKKKKLPPFLDHFNARDLKTLFRCSVAFWVASLLLLVHPTLHAFGEATFFACIVILFVPPSGIVFVFFLGGLTMIVGMALAWTWGVITMKAALATRPRAETLAREQQLSQQASLRPASIYPAATVLIDEGFMLDTRVSVTFFCMLGLFIYLLARLEKRAPKFMLTTIFGWIVTDIFLTIGPLLPAFEGTIPQVLVKPAAAAIAISLGCSILIFPETTSHMTLFTMEEVVVAMTESLHLTTDFLESYPDTPHIEQMQSLRASLLGTWTALESSLDFLPFDFSVGYWNAGDIVSLSEPIRRTIVTSLSLLSFEVLQSRSRDKIKQLSTDQENEESTVFGKHQIIQSLNLVESLRQPDVNQSVCDSYGVLSSVGSPLMKSCKEALQALAHGIHENNTRRWFKRMSAEEFASMIQGQIAVLERLREEKVMFPIVVNEALFASHQHLFSNGRFHGGQTERHKLVGMFFGFNYEDRLLSLASALECVLAQVILIENERKTVRVWFPSGLRKFGGWVFGRTMTPSVHPPAMEDLPPANEAIVQETRQSFQRTHTPNRKRGLVPRAILRIGHWLSNDEGIFAFRVLLATIAAAVPAVCSTSAGFFYREKGLWALIMAQTGTAMFSAEFNFAVITRVFGTVAGGVIGMVGW